MPVPRTVLECRDAQLEQPGLRWLDWAPHLSGEWRLWRTGDRPLEFTGTALTPRFSQDDEVPPPHRYQAISQRLDLASSNFPQYSVSWPDYGLLLADTVLTCGNWPVDVLVVRADSGQLVLGWTEDAHGTPSPPAGEVHEPYPYPVQRHEEPHGFLYELSPQGGVRFRAEVFESAEELRTWVGSGGNGRLQAASVRLVRWAVDLASEFEPSLDVRSATERLSGPEGVAADAGPRRAECSVCGETRLLLDFYDDVHKVWMLKDEPWIHVDHGKAAALMPPIDADLSRQADVLADRLASSGASTEWLSVFDFDAEQRCCGPRDHWAIARHVTDHRPTTLIEVSSSRGTWSVSPWVAVPGNEAIFTIHKGLQAELVARRYEVNSGGAGWETRLYDDPRSCASDLLALLEGAGIPRPLIVQRAQPAMGEVLETILPT